MLKSWYFAPLRPLHYSVILIDPPWKFKLRSKKGIAKSHDRHYRTMEDDEIASLPVNQLAANDCLLFMWATWPKLDRALMVLKAWGFVYKTGGAWVKTTSGGKIAFGTGYVMRSATEPFLIGVIGQPKIDGTSERNVMLELRREHSRKPDEQYAMLERLCPTGPRCELFSKTSRPGWDAFGDQAGTWESDAADQIHRKALPSGG